MAATTVWISTRILTNYHSFWLLISCKFTSYCVERCMEWTDLVFIGDLMKICELSGVESEDIGRH